MEMNATRGRRLGLLSIVAVLVGVLAFSASASAKTVVYNNIVEPLPGNFASIGFEATSTAEFGGQVQLAGTARKHPKITVAMSAWGCEEGGVFTGETCKRPKEHKKFKWPLTLNIYEVGPGNTIGAKIASETREFKMPYRPDSSKACSEAGDEGAWLDTEAPGSETIEKCFHGIAFTVKFKPELAASLPTNVILTLSYNTSNHGPAPVGAAPCQSTTAGCYYDSLNLAVIEPSEGGAKVGSDPTETQYVNSGWSEMYCGSSANLNTLQPVECPSWYEGDQPAFKVEAGGS
jgi:hypothetical protein